MTNLDPFAQASFEWPFNELFFSDVSLRNQYKYIASNIFLAQNFNDFVWIVTHYKNI